MNLRKFLWSVPFFSARKIDFASSRIWQQLRVQNNGRDFEGKLYFIAEPFWQVWFRFVNVNCDRLPWIVHRLVQHQKSRPLTGKVSDRQYLTGRCKVTVVDSRVTGKSEPQRDSRDWMNVFVNDTDGKRGFCIKGTRCE